MLVGCKMHSHTYDDAWTSGESTHWHTATCEHTEIKNGEEPHIFGNWIVTKEATEDEEGSRKHVCTVCSFEESEAIEKLPHTHKFDNETWTSDESTHWHPATCEHTDIKNGEEPHTFGEGVEENEGTAFTCTTCGYKDIRPSIYRVDSETFASILDRVDNFTRTETNKDTTYHVYFDGTTLRMCYYDDFIITHEVDQFIRYTFDADYDLWIKDSGSIVIEETYDYNMQYAKRFIALKNSFSDLRFDVTKKAYVADSITVEGSTYENVYFAFNNDQVVEISLVYGNLTYTYTEFGSTVIEIPTNAHEHKFSTEWTKTPYLHYYEALCGHDDLTMNEGPHTFGDWIVTKEATEDEEGLRKHVCTVCLYEESETIDKLPHTHKFATEWTYDETNHWKTATCEHTEEISGYSLHDYDEGIETNDGIKYTCNTCSYYKFELSDYMVTAETFATIMESIDNFTLTYANETGSYLVIISDVLYFQGPDLGEYFVRDGDNYYQLGKFEGEDDWTKNAIDKSDYDGFKLNYRVLSLFKDSFSNLSYDAKTRSYVGDIVLGEEPDALNYKNCAFYFEKGNLIKASFTLLLEDYDGNILSIPYEYTEIGKSSKEIPTNIHEHTFSEEWSYDISSHFHISTCEHGVRIDNEAHTFDNGLCTICGYTTYILSDDGKTLVEMNDNGITSFTIPTGVTSIGNNAFSYCLELKNVIIPTGVTSIGNYAFINCEKLEEIIIPESVTNIGEYAFQSCNSLANIVLSEGLLTIGTCAFDFCTALTSITIPSTVETIQGSTFRNCENLKRIVLSEGTKTLKYLAFYKCFGLTEIVIPKSITTIGNEIFSSTALSSIFFNGNQSEWDNITIGKTNKEINSATIYFYSETEPTESGNFWRFVDGVPTKW